MKTILSLLLLSALALLAGLDLAAAGLLLVAVVLLIGDLVQARLPESPCTHDCSQGDRCSCPLASQRREP
jgi:hypothetical protein